MLRWLAQNIGNILLSIILAAVVWVIAVNEANPYTEDVFASIPIVIVNQPPDTIVYAVSATAVDVSLRMPQTVRAGLSASAISVTLDLSAVQPPPTAGQDRLGEVVLPVGVHVPDQPTVRVLNVEPAEVRFTLEPIGAAPAPVEITLVGDPPAGYEIVRTTTQPMTVTASGPASWVSQVTRAASEVGVQSVSEPVSRTVTLRALDANGQVVPNVELDPERALVTVQVRQLAGFRSDLAVKIELTGTIASGYRLAEVRVTPPNVTLIGSPSALEALPGFVETEPIDISGARADIEQEARLKLSPDVALYSGQVVRVLVKIEPIVGSLTIPSTPITIGLQTGLSARVSPESVQVILVGALPVLDTIDLERDVRVILDLSGLGVGTHLITPTVETPEGVTAQSILPATVQVTIERASRVAPTVTPTRRP
jgi:YbbR domain-containing protein